IGVKILRRHAELVGLKSDFTILDVDDQIRLLKQVLEAADIDEKRWPARVLASLIDGWKNRGLPPDKVPAGEAATFADGRGAELDNILRFEKDFPGARVIRLERNYRSTAHILAAASHLITHNEGRLGKTLRTDEDPGEKVTVTGAWDSEEEARSIGEEIEAL